MGTVFDLVFEKWGPRGQHSVDFPCDIKLATNNAQLTRTANARLPFALPASSASTSTQLFFHPGSQYCTPFYKSSAMPFCAQPLNSGVAQGAGRLASCKLNASNASVTLAVIGSNRHQTRV